MFRGPFQLPVPPSPYIHASARSMDEWYPFSDPSEYYDLKCLFDCAREGETLELMNIVQRYPTWINFRDCDGFTPLTYASDRGHLTTVLALLAHGASVEAGREVPLILASCQGHLGIVQALLAHGADRNCVDKDGWTPLHLASEYGHLPVVKALLARGANGNIVNANGMTPLHAACQYGSLPIVEELLKTAVDCSIQDREGSTALDIANMWSHGDIVTALKRHLMYPARRQFIMFLSDYQFLEPPARFPRESVVEKVLVIEDLHRYLMTFM